MLQDQLALQAKLQQEIDADLNHRIEVHKANIARLTSARIGAENLAAAIGNRPLVMLAQGDSWFDYPLDGNLWSPFGTDVIAQLRRLGAMPPTILNLAAAGSTAVSEMSLKRQSKMIDVLRDRSNWIDGKPNAILFSAGGNDIAGEEFCIFLDFNDGKSRGLNEKRFAGALASIQACYLDLFSVRDRIAPGVPIFGHCYDFPIPNGSHPIWSGPWLKPSLDYCNWSVADGTKIVHEALAEFKAMLATLAADATNDFHLIDTQGTLAAGDWSNELHPTPAGFKTIAEKFAEALDANLCPTFGANFALSLDMSAAGAGKAATAHAPPKKRSARAHSGPKKSG